jgi:plastocyanin
MELAGQESFPTDDQLTRYQELAPPEIADAVNIAVPAFIAAGGDTVQFYKAFASDDVEQSLAEINAWETDNCGIDHSGEPGAPLAGGATREREDGATVVDVVATDYAFQLGSDAIAPGRTSLVLTNNGQEAHYIQLFKLAEGATVEQVMASQDGGDGLIEGSWDSGVAAPGGDDEEALTLDLEPGTYGIACFIGGADGTPHAFMGMTSEFTVA